MSSLAPYADACSLLLAASLVPVENIHRANEPFQEPQTSIWLSIDAHSNVLGILDLGADHWREDGNVMIYVCGPSGTGTDDLRTIAKQVCNVFRGLPPRNPYYANASIGSGGLSDAGDYFILPVTVSFHYEDSVSG